MTSRSPTVAVIGAGAIGMACALRLAQRGAVVTVFEAAPTVDAGFGAASASVRAAGMLGAVSELLHEPAHAHPGAAALRLEGLARWRDEQGGGAVFFGGVLHIARTTAHAQRLEHLGEAAQEAGLRVQRLTPADVAREDPLLAARDAAFGLIIHDEGQVAPRAQLMFWSRACKAIGVRFVSAAVTQLARENAGWRVCSADHTGMFDEVVMACGAAKTPMLQEIAPSLAYLTSAEGCRIAVTPALGLKRTTRFDDVYVAQTGDESLIGGGMLAPPVSDEDRAALRDRLVEALRLAAPGASIAPPVHPIVTFAARPMSPDASPLIGRDGVHGALIAAGHGRNGWLLAPLTADIIAAHIFDDAIAPLWRAFSPQRFGVETV